ncbi:MAG TPA: NEW3 domain-containing protein, partial [Mycobacteriales bacterium]|nr:NEW3 domain-containing protein [Mycobacteriales bacterium]
AVHLSPGEVVADGPVTLRATVASDLVDQTQHVLVQVIPPEGWRVEPAERPVSLASGGFTGYDVTVHPPVGAARASYLVAIQACGADGRPVEDVATVHIGSPRRRFGTEVSVALDIRGVLVRPGERAEVPVLLRNGLRSPVRGEARVIAPWGAWELVGAGPVDRADGVDRDGRPAVRSASVGFTLDAGRRGRVSFPVRVPSDAPAGSYWVLVKVTYAGRVAYTETVPLVVASR